MENKDFDIKITKRTLLWEPNNDMCHNYYYLVQGRIYKKVENEYKRYRKFKFVVWFDIFELQEFADKEWVSKDDQLEFVTELAFSRTERIKSYNDVDEFYNDCNESIRDFNQTTKGAWF